MLSQDLKGLEQTIKYRFRDRSLLLQALTHSSYTNEQMWDRRRSYERLEFLGDSVLSLVVCNYLYRTYPEHPEGELTKMRKKVVCQGALAEYAAAIGLGQYLLLGKGEEKDGRSKPKLLEDAFEALLGAMYLDTNGDLSTVADFLLPFVRVELQKDTPLEDYKTRLQQFVQQTPGERLSYEPVDEQGPDNAKIFTVRVLINSNEFGIGIGSSKKEAEQNAAREALERYLSTEQ